MILPTIEVQPEAQVTAASGTATPGTGNPAATVGTHWSSFSAAFGASLRETTATPRVEVEPNSDLEVGAKAVKTLGRLDGDKGDTQVAAGGAAKTARSVAVATSGSDVLRPGTRGLSIAGLGKRLAGLTAEEATESEFEFQGESNVQDTNSPKSSAGKALVVPSMASVAKNDTVAVDLRDANEATPIKLNEFAKAPELRMEVASPVSSASSETISDGALTLKAKNIKAFADKMHMEPARPLKQGCAVDLAATLPANVANAMIAEAKPAAGLEKVDKNSPYLPSAGEIKGADAFGTTVTAAAIKGAPTKAAASNVIGASAKSSPRIVQTTALVSRVAAPATATAEPLIAEAPSALVGGTQIGVTSATPASAMSVPSADRQPGTVVVPPTQTPDVLLPQATALNQSKPIGTVAGLLPSLDVGAGPLAERASTPVPEAGAITKAAQTSDTQQSTSARPQPAGNAAVSANTLSLKHLASAPTTKVPSPDLAHTLATHLPASSVAGATSAKTLLATSEGASRQMAEMAVRSRAQDAAEVLAEPKAILQGTGSNSIARLAADTRRDAAFAGASVKQPMQTSILPPGAASENPIAPVNVIADSTQTVAAATQGGAPTVDASVGSGFHSPGLPAASVIASGTNNLSTGTAGHAVLPIVQGAAGPGTSAAASSAISQALSGGVAGATHADSPAIAGPHRTIVATPTTLEVGVSDGTQGWLRIRAQVGDQGQVNASLAAGSSVGQETLHRELPALNAYLHGQQMPVIASVVERTFATGTGQTGSIDDAGRGTAANSGLAHAGTEGGRQQQSDNPAQAVADRVESRELSRSYTGSVSVSDLGLASRTSPGTYLDADGLSGRWLNVQA